MQKDVSLQGEVLLKSVDLKKMLIWTLGKITAMDY